MPWLSVCFEFWPPGVLRFSGIVRQNGKTTQLPRTNDRVTYDLGDDISNVKGDFFDVHDSSG
jgi:hypothetical protein